MPHYIMIPDIMIGIQRSPVSGCQSELLTLHTLPRSKQQRAVAAWNRAEVAPWHRTGDHNRDKNGFSSKNAGFFSKLFWGFEV
jgi:hypothetical protein